MPKFSWWQVRVDYAQIHPCRNRCSNFHSTMRYCGFACLPLQLTVLRVRLLTVRCRTAGSLAYGNEVHATVRRVRLLTVV